MERYAIFLDIDGTLYQGGHPVPQGNVEAIRRVRERGHLCFLNTGRALSHVPAVLTEQICFDGFVCGLGTYVKVGEEVLLNKCLPRELYRRVAEIILQTGGRGRLQGEHMIFHVGGPGEDGLPLTRLEQLDAWPDFRCNKVTFDGQPPQWALDELRDRLQIYTLPTYTEAAAVGYDKALGMRLALERVGVPPERAIAMGDSANDREMLLAAGISVAMGDGEAEVRRMCKYVTGPCLAGGVGQFLTRFLLADDA